MSIPAVSVSLDDTGVYLLPELGQALWSWAPCTGCASRETCISSTCSHQRVNRLERYWQFYKAVVTSYVEECRGSQAVLKTHGDIFQAILLLRSHPDVTLKEFCRLGFHRSSYDALDLRKAVALVVKVLLMAECAAPHRSSDRLEKASFRIYWKDEVAFSKYIQDIFPVENHHVLSYGDSDLLIDMKSELKAVKLKKRLRLSFRATHDIRNHLYFDRRAHVLEIFHHTAFLKEQLRATKGTGDFSNPSTSIRA